jgi:hypothetical protein
MTHMETVYAADKNVTSFDVSGNRTTVPWIVLTLRMYITGLDEATYFLWLGKNTAGIRTRRMPVQPRTEYPDSPDISNDVSFTSMTAHGDSLRADKNVTVSTFPGFRTTVPWIARMLPMSTSLVWTKLQHILLWLGENSAGISETRGCQCKPLQNIPMP